MSLELSPRQRLIETLSDDLSAGPWDQKSKMWYLKGDVGDEWLEYAGEFTGPVENRLLDLIIDASVPKGTAGICVAVEGWDYSQALAAALRAKGDHAVRAYWALYPPSEHPQRVETRNLILTCSDGEAVGLTVRHDRMDVAEWAHLDGSTPSPTGNRVIDVARALLGQNPHLLERLPAREDLRTLRRVAEVLQQAVNGDLTQVQTTVAMLDAIPAEQRNTMIAEMPDAIRVAIREVLSEQDRVRYGLN